MVWFNACPRCHTGDMALENDMYGWHIMCLACGFVKDLDEKGGRAVLLAQERPRVVELEARSA